MPLLTDLERHRLFNRSNEDPRSRATNDRRARKKLEAWLDGLNDASLILGYLPSDQTNKILRDTDVYFLLIAGFDAAKIKQFSPISGKINEPETWKLESKPVENQLDLRSPYSDNSPERNATDLDIYRAKQLLSFLHMLNKHLVNTKIETNMQNPIDVIWNIPNFLDPKIDDRLTKDELKGVTRVRQAWLVIARKRFDEEERLRTKEKGSN